MIQLKDCILLKLDNPNGSVFEFVVDDKATKEIYWNAGVETC